MHGSDVAPPTREEKLRKVLELIAGPDFPTGGFIVGRTGIQQAYLTGRGGHHGARQGRDRGEKKGDKVSIIVTEIPYQVNKAKLLERIAELVREKVDRGHLRHARRIRPRGHAHRHRAEARRGGRGGAEQPVQAHVAADHVRRHHAGDRGGRPRVLPVVDLLERSSSSGATSSGGAPSSSCARPRRAPTSSRGCKIALDHLDAVITLIRASRNPAEARAGLVREFGLSELAGPGHPRHAAAAAHRPRAPEDPRRAGRTAEDHRAAAGHPRQRRAC